MFPIRRFQLTRTFANLSHLENRALNILRYGRQNTPKVTSVHTNTPFLTRKKHPPNPFSPSKAPVTRFVRTNDYRRTDVSAPSWSFVRTKTTTCFHFSEPEGARFPMCEIASVRVKRPTEGNEGRDKPCRRKENLRKSCQPVFRESREKGLPGHQSVFGRNEAPSRAIHLTF